MRIKRTPDWTEVLSTAIDSRVSGLHTMIPGRVEKYDAGSQKADVLPLVDKVVVGRDGQSITDRYEVIPDVPLRFYRSGDYFISLPVKQGSYVMLVFAEHSTDRWLEGPGGPVDPVDPRKHSLSDAFAIPMMYPNGKALADAHEDNLVIGKDGGAQAHFKSDEIHLGEENAAELIALGQKVDDRFDAIENYLSSLQTTFNTHTHPAPIIGSTSPPTSPATGNPTGSSTQASKVKAT